MAIFVDERGKAIESPGGMEYSHEIRSRLRDMLIVKFAHRNVSTREMGRIFRMTHQAVQKRLKAIPPHVKKRYVKFELWSQEQDFDDE